MRPNYALPRLHVPGNLTTEVLLEAAQSHYLTNVLRLGPGERVRVFNAETGEVAMEIAEIGKKWTLLRFVEALHDPLPSPDLRLLFAPLRRARTATVIEKATELGASEIQPVLTDHTQFPKLNTDKMRLQSIEAAEQTERLDLPDILIPVPLLTLLDAWDDAPILFGDEAGDAPPMSDVLHDVSLPLAVLVGPEGGFSPREREVLRAHPKVHPVTLGPRILRADTAAISMMTLVQSALGDWV